MQTTASLPEEYLCAAEHGDLPVTNRIVGCGDGGVPYLGGAALVDGDGDDVERWPALAVATWLDLSSMVVKPVLPT